MAKILKIAQIAYKLTCFDIQDGKTQRFSRYPLEGLYTHSSTSVLKQLLRFYDSKRGDFSQFPKFVKQPKSEIAV